MHRIKWFKIAIPLLSVLLLSSVYFGFSAVSGPQIQSEPPWDFPRLQRFYMVEAHPSATAYTMAQECKIDVFLGATSTTYIDGLAALGWNVTHSGGGLHYCYFGFNCRDYVPPWEEPLYNYHDRNPGFPLFPLNVSSFRLALCYIIGCERTSWCWEIMRYIVVRNDFPMPPGFGEWRNPYIMEYPEDWVYAMDILLENGFTYDDGGHPEDRTYWTWYCPLRPGEATPMKLVGGKNSASPGSGRPADGLGTIFGILAMSPDTVTVSMEFVRRHVKKWNLFFIGEDLEGLLTNPAEWYALFRHDPLLVDYIIETVWYNRNHDIFYLCGAFSARNPDYLFDTFHSSQDVWGGNNDPGPVSPCLDLLLYTIKTFVMKDYELLAYNVGAEDQVIIPVSTHFTVPNAGNVLDIKIERAKKTGVWWEYLVPGVDYELVGDDLHILKEIVLEPGEALEVNYVEGTYSVVVTDIDRFRDIVWLADWKIFYLVPQMGNYGRDYYDLFKPNHEGWVQGVGYGAGAYNLPWTFGLIHEIGLWVGGSMQWQNEGNVVSLNPIKARWVYEAEILNRIFDGLITRNATSGQEMPWIALKVRETYWEAPEGPGQIIRIYLREGVTWHDGDPITAEDIKWNFDYINHTCPDLAPPEQRMPEFMLIWQFYKGCNIIDDYTIDIYINTTGHWKTLDYLGSALTFRQIIWESKITYADATGFRPWAENYVAYTGQEPTGSIPGADLTCLIGPGPFFLNYTAGSWNEDNLAILDKNPDYWVRKSGQATGGVLVGVSHGESWIVTFTNVLPIPVTVFSWQFSAAGWGTTPPATVVIGPMSTYSITVASGFSQVSPYEAYWIKVNDTIAYQKQYYELGDLGRSPPPTFFAFDGQVNTGDLALWLMCFKSTCPANAKYLGDLGKSPPPTFFAFDGQVNTGDLALWLINFKAGPPYTYPP